MIGIERISFYTPAYAIDMRALAKARGVDPAKYCVGIGQDTMAVAPIDEDVVSMAANAAQQCLEGLDKTTVDTVIFATETGVDQSKAAGVYVHSLLGLPGSCQVYEMKQACCGGSLALHAALDRVARRPEKQVLVIAADVARYGLGTAGEPTQGAGAVAFVVSAQPRIIEIFPQTGYFTQDVMDFWRPNYMEEALVDGKFSVRMYLRALESCWHAYAADGGLPIQDLDRFCYHQPFTTMAYKAHRRLFTVADVEVPDVDVLAPSLRYNRLIGNTYGASLFISLCSLLEQTPVDMAGEHVGLFGYGSGCVGTFYAGRVIRNYRAHLKREEHECLLANRCLLSISEYEAAFRRRLPIDGSMQVLEESCGGPFHLEGIENHKRIYGRRRREAGANLGVA